MNIRTIVLTTVVSATIMGCQSYAWIDRAKELSERGQCEAARQVTLPNTDQMQHLTAMMSIIYGLCDRNERESIKWMTLSARYGNEKASLQLARNGHPVPPADLAQKEQQLSASEIYLLMNSSKPAQRAPMNTNCITTGLSTSCTTY